MAIPARLKVYARIDRGSRTKSEHCERGSRSGSKRLSTGAEGSRRLDGTFQTFALLAVGAAAASPLGGVIALFLRPSTFILSVVVGFAGGVLLGASSFEMIPKALELAEPIEVYIGIPIGVLLVWGVDLYI